MPGREVWRDFRYLAVLFFRLAKLSSVPIKIPQLEIVCVVIWLGFDCLTISSNRLFGSVRFIVGSCEPVPGFWIARVQFRGASEVLNGALVGSMLLLERTRDQQYRHGVGVDGSGFCDISSCQVEPFEAAVLLELLDLSVGQPCDRQGGLWVELDRLVQIGNGIVGVICISPQQFDTLDVIRIGWPRDRFLRHSRSQPKCASDRGDYGLGEC